MSEPFCPQTQTQTQTQTQATFSSLVTPDTKNTKIIHSYEMALYLLEHEITQSHEINILVYFTDQPN